MKKIVLVFACLLLSQSAIAAAEPDFSRFEKETNFEVIGIVTPKVVRFQTSEHHGPKTVLVDESGEIISHRWTTKREKVKPQKIFVESVSSEFEGTPENLVDGNSGTSFTFHPTQAGPKKVILRFPEKTKVSQISVVGDSGIIFPRKFSVRADFGDGDWLPILENVKFQWQVRFPEISVTRLELSYETPHFFRLNEIHILGEAQALTDTNELIFFAKDGAKYSLYSQAHFGIKSDFRPAKPQPLQVDNATPIFIMKNSAENLRFNPDFDEDGINDDADLCPQVSDPTNADIDVNGRGDVCEDPDLDGIFSEKDNCPFAHNVDQKDSDQDGAGDECDDDEDRWTESSDFLLSIVFGIGALLLGFLVFRSYKR